MAERTPKGVKKRGKGVRLAQLGVRVRREDGEYKLQGGLDGGVL